MVACMMGNVDIVQVLLKAGANVLHSSSNGHSAISAAEHSENSVLIDLINEAMQKAASTSVAETQPNIHEEGVRSPEENESINQATAEYMRANL